MAKVLSFAECDTRQCVHVTIVDDVIVEQNEDFSVVLETTPDMYSRITLNPASGHVHIISEDGQFGEGIASFLLFIVVLPVQLLWLVWRKLSTMLLKTYVQLKCVLG